MRAIFQADPIKSRQRLFFVRHAVQVLRQHHIFNRREVGNQVELLKNESDFFRAYTVQVARGDAGHILVVNPDFTGCRTIKAADQIHKR